MNIRIPVDETHTGTQDRTLPIAQGTVIEGTYFGAEGTFRCSAAPPCTITRASTGSTPFQVADTNAETDGIQGGGTWVFTPDDDAMVLLPDQDWMAFGFWLTAPDDTAEGTHRLGIFYDGMDTYGYEAARTGDDALDGEAMYTGSATGYYVNDDEDGMFTADASLTAVFNDGAAADPVTNMLSGRIDNFRDSMGRYLDSDTRDAVNQGGENDWFVRLDADAIQNDGSTIPDDNEVGEVGGSADGVLWADGEWAAQLYGGGDRLTPSFAAPTGVAGQFRAVTDQLSTVEGTRASSARLGRTWIPIRRCLKSRIRDTVV